MSLSSKLTALANSIRAKSGANGLLSLDAMKTEIDSMEPGCIPMEWFENITAIRICKILTEETAYDIDLSSCTSLSTMASFMNSNNNKVSSVTLKMPPGWVGDWSQAFYCSSANSQNDLLSEITIDTPVKPMFGLR